MKILLISPIAIPIKPESKYVGIEKLVYQFAVELAKNHDVSVMCHKDSVFPEGVKTLPALLPLGNLFIQGELRHYQSYGYMLRSFDIVHDFSHSQFASRYNPNLPSLNPFWHSPRMDKYPKSPYNIIALSEWASREFKRIYLQDARYVQSIVVGDEYVPLPKSRKTDRFLTLGKMSPEKGNLAAIMLCKELALPLDVVGARGVENSGELSEYEQAIQALCDGKQIKFHGEIDDAAKIRLLQTCRGLLYAMPPSYSEVTSHKVQEALLCGAPVISSAVGAMPEIVTHGVDGFLCGGEQDFKDNLKRVDELDPSKTLESNLKKYSIHNVVAEYVKLYEQVKGGLRW